MNLKLKPSCKVGKQKFYLKLQPTLLDKVLLSFFIEIYHSTLGLLLCKMGVIYLL